MARLVPLPLRVGARARAGLWVLGGCGVDVDVGLVALLHFLWPSRTLVMKVTMALAGWSGSSSAKRWHTFSQGLPGFLATKPKILEVVPSGLVHLRSWGSVLEKVMLPTG